MLLRHNVNIDSPPGIFWGLLPCPGSGSGSIPSPSGSSILAARLKSLCYWNLGVRRKVFCHLFLWGSKFEIVCQRYDNEEVNAFHHGNRHTLTKLSNVSDETGEDPVGFPAHQYLAVLLTPAVWSTESARHPMKNKQHLNCIWERRCSVCNFDIELLLLLLKDTLIMTIPLSRIQLALFFILLCPVNIIGLWW